MVSIHPVPSCARTSLGRLVLLPWVVDREWKVVNLPSPCDAEVGGVRVEHRLHGDAGIRSDERAVWINPLRHSDPVFTCFETGYVVPSLPVGVVNPTVPLPALVIRHLQRRENQV